MKLTEYPGLLGQWPPHGCSVSNPLLVSPIHCLDTLIQAIRFWRVETSNWGITILTVFKAEKYVRRLPGRDEIFATVFCEFLNKQRGKTILDIGELDATFLG